MNETEVPDAIPELLPVFRVRHQVDRRVGLPVQRPLSEVLLRDRAVRLGGNLRPPPIANHEWTGLLGKTPQWTRPPKRETESGTPLSQNE